MFSYTNASSDERSVTLRGKLYPSTAEGEGEAIDLPNPITFTVGGNATTDVDVAVTLPDAEHAFRLELVEDNGTLSGGTRAHTMLVANSIKRVIVEDAMTELTRITPAMEQTDRVGYVSIRCRLIPSNCTSA